MLLPGQIECWDCGYVYLSIRNERCPRCNAHPNDIVENPSLYSTEKPLFWGEQDKGHEAPLEAQKKFFELAMTKKHPFLMLVRSYLKNKRGWTIEFVPRTLEKAEYLLKIHPLGTRLSKKEK